MFISVHMYMWVKWNENPMHFMGKERHNLANLNDGKLPQFHTKYVASKVTVTMCKMAIRSCSSHQLITIHMWALHWSHHERNYNIAFFFLKIHPAQCLLYDYYIGWFMTVTWHFKGPSISLVMRRGACAWCKRLALKIFHLRKKLPLIFS